MFGVLVCVETVRGILKDSENVPLIERISGLEAVSDVKPINLVTDSSV